MVDDTALGSDIVVLVADSDTEVADTLARRLISIEPDVRVIGTRRLSHVLGMLESEQVGCVVTDLDLRDVQGVDVVRRLRVTAPRTPIVVFTGAGSEDLAVASMRLGIADYIRKECGPGALTSAVREALGHAVLGVTTARCEPANGAPCVRRFGGANLVATTHGMRRVLDLVEKAIESSAPVLLEGETGTGKELLARAIHIRGVRRNEPFLVQNCAALSETLLESELFGHVRGAFTGADRDRRGLFLEAGAGTVFLDEIGEAPAAVQPKLLRVLQHGEVKPVGADRVQPLRARIIAATNRVLADEVAARRFRADLYYRLNVLPIRIPPLRQRVEDVRHLLAYFREIFEQEEGRTIGGFAAEAIRALEAHSWPGNVRELDHEVHRLVITVPQGEPVRAKNLKDSIRTMSVREPRQRLDTLLARVELALIRDRLRWMPTKAAAARSLGITREALYLKLKRLGAVPDGERADPDFLRGAVLADEAPEGAAS